MKLEVEIDTQETEKAKAIAKALAEDSKPKRGTVTFSNNASKLIIKIDCDDAVAVRAAANSSLRLADSCLSII